jgi:hypothetical protein
MNGGYSIRFVLLWTIFVCAVCFTTAHFCGA